MTTKEFQNTQELIDYVNSVLVKYYESVTSIEQPLISSIEECYDIVITKPLIRYPDILYTFRFSVITRPKRTHSRWHLMNQFNYRPNSTDEQQAYLEELSKNEYLLIPSINTTNILGMIDLKSIVIKD